MIITVKNLLHQTAPKNGFGVPVTPLATGRNDQLINPVLMFLQNLRPSILDLLFLIIAGWCRYMEWWEARDQDRKKHWWCSGCENLPALSIVSIFSLAHCVFMVSRHESSCSTLTSDIVWCKSSLSCSSCSRAHDCIATENYQTGFFLITDTSIIPFIMWTLQFIFFRDAALESWLKELELRT